MALHGENWIEWELDPSTRSSVHLWTKYVPITGASIDATAEDLFTVNRGVPSVNQIKNPSFEHESLAEFTVIGTCSLTKILYSSTSEVADDLPSPIDGRTSVAKVSRAADNSTEDSDGFYYKDTFAVLGFPLSIWYSKLNRAKSFVNV